MSEHALITRQPVLNKQRAITANRLIVHVRGASPGQRAAATLVALEDVWPAERTVFVGFGGVLPDPGLLEWRPPENAMIEIPAAALNAAPTVQLMQALEGAGTHLCLDGHVPARSLPAGSHFRFVIARHGEVVAPGSAPGLLLAKDLPDLAAFQAAVGQGYAGAAGWFFLHTPPAGKKLAPAHAQIVRLMNLVRRNAEIRDIEAAFKQDVALSFKLLRYINSVGFGLSCEIHSFRHAVAILGYDKLHKWLSLLLVTASRDPSAIALMQTAIARGRFMELAGADYFGKGETDNLFIAGAFSLLPTLLDAPLEAVLAEMHLPESLTDALAGRDSVYTPFLDLALACEQDTDARLAELAEALQLAPLQVNRAHMQALSFADSLNVG